MRFGGVRLPRQAEACGGRPQKGCDRTRQEGGR